MNTPAAPLNLSTKIRVRLAVTAAVAAVLLAGLILSIQMQGYGNVNGKAARPELSAYLVATGKFKKVRSLLVTEGDGSAHDIRDHLASETCFVPGDSSSDAVLNVELYLLPPVGRESGYTILDMATVYKATITSRSGRRLWTGAEGTRQRVIFAPGIHMPPGTTWHRDVAPLDAELLLLRDLRLAGCANVGTNVPAKD